MNAKIKIQYADGSWTDWKTLEEAEPILTKNIHVLAVLIQEEMTKEQVLEHFEWEKELTEEEMKKREEFRNSPTGQLLIKMFSDANSYMKTIANDIMTETEFFKGTKWGPNEIGKVLKIRLPDDYKK